MNKNRLVIPIIFVFVLITAGLSGCFNPNTILLRHPLATRTQIDWRYETITLWGYWSIFCHVEGIIKIAWDSESHKNWENYSNIEACEVLYELRESWLILHVYDDIQPDTDYYYRVVAYCYDFIGTLRDFEDGIYQSKERTFRF